MIDLEDGKYYIQIKDRCYTLAEKVVDKKGKEIFKGITYHGSLEEALQSYCRYKQSDLFENLDMLDLRNAAMELRDLAQKIVDKFHEIFYEPYKIASQAKIKTED